MTAVPLPLLSSPGRQTQAAGGRLINCYPEKLAETAGEKLIYWRVPGLAEFGSASSGIYRGAILVGNVLYCVFDEKVFSFVSTGGSGTELSGTVPGTAPCILARDNASTPNIVIVSPGEGAFVVSGSSVSSYPDIDVGQPNAVTYLRGSFHFTYGNGKVRNSDTNSLNINTLSVATAESKPDALYRPIPLGNGQLLLAGSSSIEVWGGNVNDVGYLFSYIATIGRGIAGPFAIAGHEDGWGKGIYLVGDDFRVSRLEGYAPVVVSPVELDLLIERDPNKQDIQVSVYVSQGHGFVSVRGTDWCWEFDTTMESWHERQSYGLKTWRGLLPVKAFDKWLCGDLQSSRLLQISGDAQDELGNPLRMRIETGPMGAFPKKMRINSIELYLTKGVGIATGSDPVQTDPDIEVSMSRDGGQTWVGQRSLKIGRQAITDIRVRSSIWGHADVQGVRWRFDQSANVPCGIMGADMQADVLA